MGQLPVSKTVQEGDLSQSAAAGSTWRLSSPPGWSQRCLLYPRHAEHPKVVVVSEPCCNIPDWPASRLKHKCVLSLPLFAITQCDQLILESLNINYIDESEYPSTTDIQNKCVASGPDCSLQSSPGLKRVTKTAKLALLHTMLQANYSLVSRLRWPCVLGGFAACRHLAHCFPTCTAE